MIAFIFTTLVAGSRKKSPRTSPDNDRQRLVLNRLLDGFTGTLTTKKWAVLTKCSHDTALRDIQSLIDHGLLTRDEGGGRSTSYSLTSATSATASS